jgi:hypothetical protein
VSSLSLSLELGGGTCNGSGGGGVTGRREDDRSSGRERVERAMCGSAYAANIADFEGGGRRRRWSRIEVVSESEAETLLVRVR